MTIDLTQIIIALIALCSALITGFVIPWIRNKVSAQKWEDLQKFAKVAVDVTEQLAKKSEITNKFEFAKTRVVEELNKHGLTFDSESIENAIESAVLNLTK